MFTVVTPTHLGFLNALLPPLLAEICVPQTLMKASDSNLRAQKPAKKKPGRAPVSCAECRRLKMKCDRGNPCENCTKRGCAVICPDGTLTTGKHNRMILSNTEELHDKIESLLDRIRMLEDALRTLQASVSTEPHPLLAAPTTEGVLSTIHIYPTNNDRAVHQRPTAPEEDDVLDSFGMDFGLEFHVRNAELNLGTLSIGSDGETNYLGETARADYLINDSDSDDDLDTGRLPRSFYNYSWPECPAPDNSTEEVVLSFLPDLNEAYALCDTYCTISSWLGLLVPREMIHDDFIAHVYHIPNRPWADTVFTCPHRLSLLFCIFSFGALFDPSQEPNNVQADDYYHLARVALSFKSAVLETTVYSVLAIVHMACILLLRDSPGAHEQGWMMLGVANKLAISMGLHKDSTRWNLDNDTCERRHTTYWQLQLMETMASFYFGRPILASDGFIECPVPRHLDERQVQAGNPESTYLSWLIQFGRLVRQTLSEIFGAKPLSYTAVLEADSRICAIADFDSQQGPITGGRDTTNAERARWCVNYCKDTMLLHIHRAFLLQALKDNPEDPPSSKYGKSVQACFESSYRLIESMAWVTEQYLQVSSRIPGLLGASISSAIVLCIIVTRCPISQVSRPAMEKLDSIHTTLQKIANVNHTARRHLVTTRRLRNLARAAFERTRLSVRGDIIPPADADMLSRGCGKTHVRTRKQHNNHGSGTRRRRSDTRSSSTLGDHSSSRENWSERVSKPGFTSTTSGVASSSSYEDNFVRLPAGQSYSSPLGHGLDTTWSTFIQQLGF